MSTDEKALLEHIAKGVDDLRVTQIPAINQHLATLNGSVARHEQRLQALESDHRALPCSTHGTDIELLKASDAHQEEKAKKHSQNWVMVVGIIVNLVVFVVQTVIAYLLTRAMQGTP